MTLSPDALHLLEDTEFLGFFRFLFFPSFHWQLGIVENNLGDMKTVVGLGTWDCAWSRSHAIQNWFVVCLTGFMWMLPECCTNKNNKVCLKVGSKFPHCKGFFYIYKYFIQTVIYYYSIDSVMYFSESSIIEQRKSICWDRRSCMSSLGSAGPQRNLENFM